MNEKKKVKITCLFIVVLLAVTCIVYIINKQKDTTNQEKSGIERNFGVAHSTTNIDINEEGEKIVKDNIDEVVPKKEQLIMNLEKNGYQVNDETVKSDSGIEANQVLATKGESYLMILYGLTDEEAKEIFPCLKKRVMKLRVHHQQIIQYTR